MNTPIIDLQELLEEVQDMIEEKMTDLGTYQGKKFNYLNGALLKPLND